MMNVAYTQAQFDQRQAEMAEAKARELAEDLDYQSAMTRLSKAQAYRDDLEGHASRIVNVKQRLAWNEQREAAKLAVRDAEKAVQSAKNDFYRSRYIVQLEEKDAQQQKAQNALQAKHAKEEEQIAKQQFKEAWLVSGGTEQAFNAQWSDQWQKELQSRAKEQIAGARRNLNARHHYEL